MVPALACFVISGTLTLRKVLFPFLLSSFRSLGAICQKVTSKCPFKRIFEENSKGDKK